MSKARFALLGPFVEYEVSGGTAIVDGPGATVRISGGEPSNALAWLEDGLHRPHEHLPPSLLDVLAEHELVKTFSSEPSDAATMLEELFGACDEWAAEIFGLPFWSCFHEGRCTEEQVFSFLAQLYHRTAGADVHNHAAVVRCSEPALLPMLERHYQEERGHAAMLGRGLIACGPRGQDFLTRPALPATTALIDYMTNLAVDSVAYVGCYGIFHAPSTVRTKEDLVAQFERFAALYPFAAPGFEAVCRHASLDYDLDHQEIAVIRWVQRHGVPSADEILRIFRGARGAARAFGRVFVELG